jgi:hypothetical protein
MVCVLLATGDRDFVGLAMNHAELTALVVQREKEGKVWVSIPTEVLKELLTHYKPEGQAVPWIGNIYSA